MICLCTAFQLLTFVIFIYYTASSTARQKQGSGKSRPAVLRGFRREAPSEPDSGTEKSSGDGTPTG